MSGGSGVLTHPVAKFWWMPVLGLTIIGAGALGVQYSEAFAGALGTTAGTIVNDIPHMVDRFQEAQSGGAPAADPAG